jgi:hypothetical protein
MCAVLGSQTHPAPRTDLGDLVNRVLDVWFNGPQDAVEGEGFEGREFCICVSHCGEHGRETRGAGWRARVVACVGSDEDRLGR